MNSKFNIAILALLHLALISIARAQNVESFGQCNTPNSEPGMCIYLEECTGLYSILQNQPVSDANREFLRRSQCGAKKKKVLICCLEHQIGEQLTPDSTDNRLRALLPEPGVCGKVILDRIVGGNETRIDEYPWMALIEYTKDGNSTGHRCGGSLINERYVLTAAHCIKQTKEVKPYMVRLGEWDRETDPDCDKGDCANPHVDVTIEKVIAHEKYDPTSNNKYNDIGLIRLSRSISYTDFIQPICLPVKDILKRSNFDGNIMDVAGWGQTEYAYSSNKKLKAGVPVVPIADCQSVYNQSRIVLSNSQMCAGGVKNIDSCKGDSGGPLIGVDASNIQRIYYFQAGIVSFGPDPCGKQGWPGVYTKVTDYIEWINDNIEP